MSPGIFRFTLPDGNGGAGASNERDRAFVARGFYDGVIGGVEKRVVEKENCFLRGSNDEQVVAANRFVERCESLTKPGSAGCLGVAAPVFQEGVVGRGFERKKVGDRSGFRVG